MKSKSTTSKRFFDIFYMYQINLKCNFNLTTHIITKYFKNRISLLKFRRETQLMNYEYIEKLVEYSKDGHTESKEQLIKEFTPYILNLCKKTFIHGYDFSDLKNECYKSLFYCVSKYNPETHRFVAYATNGIKNNIYDLVRKSQTRKSLDSSETLIITDEFQETLVSDLIGIEDFLCKKSDYIELHKAIKNLNADEQEMINFLFFSND